MKRHMAFFLALTLITSLFTGTVASGAQTPGSLTQVFTWDAYRLAVRYPANWIAVDNGTTISIHPADRDVSDGYGPELVLFNATGARPTDLEAAINTFATHSGAAPERFIRDEIAGRVALAAPLVWSEPAARGAMQLIVFDDQSVIGVAYVVRVEDSQAYALPLVEIMQSLAFNADGSVQSVRQTSVSIASVRLTEAAVWDDAGLILSLPEGWESETAMLDGSATIIAVPSLDDGSHRVIQATTVDGFDFLDLRALAELTAADYDLASEIVATTVAGYPAVTYEFRDMSGDTALYMRALLINITDRGVIGLVIFVADETAWASFRPTVSAVSGSIRAITGGRSGLTLIAQDDPTFIWEEAGVTLTLADGWITQSGDGQDFDLALISPEVQETGQGSFVKLRLIPMLGTSPDELAAAIQPIADQIGAEMDTDYSLAGMDGVGINYTDEGNTGYLFHFVLLPYGDRGDALYVQSTASPEADPAVLEMLNTITVDIPTPDYAAVDAAWQQSLAENGTLTVGDADAPMTIIEYLSFTCGHCVNYSRSMERLIALDVETGRVQLGFAALGGDEHATRATHATYCAAEQGKGFSAAEALFQGYSELGYQRAYSRDGITELLSELDLDIDELNTCIDEQRYQDALTQTSVDFTNLGLTGTPTITFGVNGETPAPVVFPNGQVWSGSVPLHWVRDIVEAYIENGTLPNEFVAQ